MRTTCFNQHWSSSSASKIAVLPSVSSIFWGMPSSMRPRMCIVLVFCVRQQFHQQLSRRQCLITSYSLHVSTTLWSSSGETH
jgi:hypothetical protein